MTDFSKEIAPGWFPWKLSADKKQMRWVFLGEKKFTESFFEQTISACLHLQENSSASRNNSTVESLPIVASGVDAAKPAALIFHISRCGSTLLSQLLAKDSRNIVLSEVPVLDEILELARKEKLIDSRSEEFVSSVVQLLARKKSEDEKHLFIKLDSWHIFHYPLLRKLFPDIPFLLLYRRPDEVYRSHMRRSGMHMIPGLIDHELLKMERESAEWTQARFGNELLSRYLREFMRIAEKDPMTQLAEYSEGIDVVALRLMNAAGIIPGKEFVPEIEARMKFHSKNPDEKFAGDPETGTDGEVMKGAMEVYHELEKMRKAVPSSVE